MEKEECDLLINSIHGKKCFNQILFCNGFLPLTPSKGKTSQDSTVDGKKSVPLVTVSSENVRISPQRSDFCPEKSVLSQNPTELTENGSTEFPPQNIDDVTPANQDLSLPSVVDDKFYSKALCTHVDGVPESSDFRSCIDSDESENDSKFDKALSKSSKIKEKKKKRKHGLTPDKRELANKKVNLQSSPQ